MIEKMEREAGLEPAPSSLASCAPVVYRRLLARYDTLRAGSQPPQPASLPHNRVQDPAHPKTVKHPSKSTNQNSKRSTTCPERGQGYALFWLLLFGGGFGIDGRPQSRSAATRSDALKPRTYSAFSRSMSA